MNHIRPIFGALILIGLFASASLAAGTAGRTFVSSLGVDTNPCSLTAPCRTFAQAISQTMEGGEVVVLNSAGYGPFTISQSVAITAPEGIYAGITQASDTADGIDVTAGPNDVVTLKGLTIIGPGASASSAFGINFESGAALHVEGCEVRGFQTDLLLQANSQSFVKDTIAKDAQIGILFFGNVAGTMSASVDNVTANNNTVGIEADVTVTESLIQASVRESQVSGNGFGIAASTPVIIGGDKVTPQVDFTTIAQIDVESCVIANGGTAIETQGGSSIISLSNCLISHNTNAGFDVAGGFIESRVNNTFNGNGSNTGSLTTLTAQ